MYKTNFKRLGLCKYRTKSTARPDQAKISTPKEVSQIENIWTWNAIFERISETVVVLRAGYAALERPARSLSISGVNSCVEALLWHVAVHSEAWLEARSSSPSLLKQTSKTWDTLKQDGPVSFALFDIGQGVAALERACNTVNEVMSKGSNNLLPIMLVEFCGKWWSHFPGLRHSLLRYLTKLAATKLGTQHPLTIILFHLMDEDVASYAMDAALQLVIQVAEREQTVLDESALSLRHAYCCMLLDYEQYQAALAPVQWLHDEAFKLHGQSGLLTRCSLLREAEIHIGLGAIDSAKLSCEKALKLSERTHLCTALDAVGIEAAARLAKLHLATGNPVAARQLCERALENPQTPFSQVPVGLRGMGLTLQVMLEEMLVATKPTVEVCGQQRIFRSQPSRYRSGEHSCQVPLPGMAPFDNLNHCAAIGASLNLSTTFYPDSSSNTELGIALPERNGGKDPFVAKHHDIVRRSARDIYPGWRDRPIGPPE